MMKKRKRGLKLALNWGVWSFWKVLFLVFVILVFISAFSEIVSADWADQDTDNTVHIVSSLYNATINNNTGVAYIYNSSGIFIWSLNSEVITNDTTIKRNSTVPISINLSVSGNTAVVSVIQNTSQVNFTTNYTFYNDSGKILYKTILDYNQNTTVHIERMLIDNNETTVQDDDGSAEGTSSSNGGLALLSTTVRGRKILNITVVSNFHGSAIRWRTGEKAGTSDTVIIDVDGTDLSTNFSGSALSSNTWYEASVPSNLLEGKSEVNVTFRCSGCSGSHYSYLAIDNETTSYYRSLKSTDSGTTWDYMPYQNITVDDDSSADGIDNGGGIYLGPTTDRARKILNISGINMSDYLSLSTRWQAGEVGGSGECTIVIDVDGTDLATNFTHSEQSSNSWYEAEIPKNLLEGKNFTNVTFRCVGGDCGGGCYSYISIDNETTSHNRSVRSADSGSTWDWDDLTNIGDNYDGEYMVRLVGKTDYDLTNYGANYSGEYMVRLVTGVDNVSFWDYIGNTFNSTRNYFYKYTPLIMKSVFSYGDLKSSIYGNSYYGAEGLDTMDESDGVIKVYMLDNRSHKYTEKMSGSEIEYYDTKRIKGEQVEASVVLELEESSLPIIVTKSKFPRAYKAGLTVTDDTDGGTTETVRAVYYGTENTSSPNYTNIGFVGHNLKITKTVWWQTGTQGIEDNLTYRNVTTDLFNKGFEIGLHTPTSGNDDRAKTQSAINNVSALYNLYTWIDHNCYCEANPGSSANYECSNCYGANSSNTTYYNIDILENSSIKYVWNCGLLPGTGISNANTFKELDEGMMHTSSYADDIGNTKKLILYGRAGNGDYPNFASYTNSSDLDTLIQENGLIIDYNHMSHTGKGWIQNTIGIWEINATVEARLAEIETRQDSGDLWVAPVSTILDWLVDLENVEFISHSESSTQANITINNTNNKTMIGITLIINQTIKSAKINDLYQIYVNDTYLILPEFSASESKEIEINTGSYNSSIPRLTFVDVDVDVLNATYNDSSNEVIVIIQNSSRGGKQSNRTLTINNYNVTQNFEVKDNSQSFAFVSDGILDSSNSNSSYLTSYNYSTGIFNFTIPTMSEHNIVFEDDTTSPTVSFSCSPTSVTTAGDTIICSCSATDNVDSSPTVSYTINPSISSTGTHSTTCTATDDAGNSISSGISYTVSSASGGGSGSYSGYDNTFVEHSKELSEIGKITKSIGAKSQVKIKINNQTHHIGVKELTETTATIEVSSTSQSIVFNIGDENKFDVTDDIYYDIYIKLNSIDENKANLTIKSIHEEIPKEKEAKKEEIEKAKSWLLILGLVVAVVLIMRYKKKKR